MKSLQAKMYSQTFPVKSMESFDLLCVLLQKGMPFISSYKMQKDFTFHNIICGRIPLILEYLSQIKAKSVVTNQIDPS
jgi:hypothetical protein